MNLRVAQIANRLTTLLFLVVILLQSIEVAHPVVLFILDPQHVKNQGGVARGLNRAVVRLAWSFELKRTVTAPANRLSAFLPKSIPDFAPTTRPSSKCISPETAEEVT